MLAWNIFLSILLGIIGIAIFVVLVKTIIAKYHIPIHRLIKYRIVKRHNTFDCLGKIGEYYTYYIQEKYYFDWKDVKDRAIPYRNDGEKGSGDKPRQGNWFETFKAAELSLNKLIEKRELEHQIKKAKEEDVVIDKDKE